MKTSVDKIAVYKLWIKMGKQLSQNVALPGCAVQLVLISDVLECESFFWKVLLEYKDFGLQNSYSSSFSVGYIRSGNVQHLMKSPACHDTLATAYVIFNFISSSW